jgi:dTDP-4-amino-4,6-dideoxygalactose transaminase
VITSSLTYVASAHEIVHCGARPVFADIDARTLNLDPACVARRIGPRTRAILLTHFAGRPCAMEAFEELARTSSVTLVSDSAHSIESQYDQRPLAPRFPLSAYSFHPVKNMTTGEGGMVTTDDAQVARELRLRRGHGVSRDAWARTEDALQTDWDVTLLGHKCNMSDIQASIGLHQLARLERNLSRRRRIAETYSREFRELPGITLPAPPAAGQRHAWHLYTIVLDPAGPQRGRAEFRRAMQAENVATGHHYPSIHRLTYYRRLLEIPDDRLPVTSRVADRIVTLPLYAAMTDTDVDSVVEAVRKISECRR